MSLMLGFMVRLAGVVGVVFILNLLIGLYNDPTEWPWTYVGIICAHGMFAVAQAGRSFGIDNLLAKRLIPGFPYDGPVARALAYASWMNRNRHVPNHPTGSAAKALPAARESLIEHVSAILEAWLRSGAALPSRGISPTPLCCCWRGSGSARRFSSIKS